MTHFFSRCTERKIESFWPKNLGQIFVPPVINFFYHIIIIIIIWISASWGVTEKGGVCCCLPLPSSCTIYFSSLSIFNNYSYPKYDCYICLQYVKEKRHCTTLSKWWADNYKMMLGRNIIVQHYINDDQTMTWWYIRENHHCLTSNK